MNHKIVISLLFFLLSGKSYSQTEITEKGYFYSPNGFVCKNGNLYTSDMKTMIRRGYSTRDSFNDNEDKFVGSYWSLSQSLDIPYGCEIIPSNIIYQPSGQTMAGRTGEHAMGYDVYIPSSVKYIALNAFMSPFVRFFSSDNQSASIRGYDDGSFNAKEVARYNLQGKKISTPESGINIVQMSDRTAHKELVK